MIGAYAKITAACGTLQGRAKSQSLGPLQEPRILLCIFGVAPIEYAGGQLCSVSEAPMG